jgi:hypothetical protein
MSDRNSPQPKRQRKGVGTTDDVNQSSGAMTAPTDEMDVSEQSAAGPTLKFKHGAHWVTVTLYELGDNGTFSIDFEGGHTDNIVRSRLTRFYPFEQQLPSAKKLLTDAAVPNLPRMFYTQREMYVHADQHGHTFFGTFQRLKYDWIWDRDTQRAGLDDGSFERACTFDGFFSFPDVQSFLSFYEHVPEGYRQFYETARCDRVVKLYGDIDDEHGNEADRSRLDKTLPLLCAFYKDCFGDTITLDQFAVTDGSRQKDNCYKNSFHFVLNNGTGFLNGSRGADMGVFMRGFVEHLKSEGHNDLIEAVDLTVYSSNRNMRMFGSFKADDHTETPFTPIGTVLEPSDYMIQSDVPLRQTVLSDDLRQRIEPKALRRGNQLIRVREQAVSVNLGDIPQRIRDAICKYAQDICPRVSFRDPRVSGIDKERDFSVYCSINGCAWSCMLCKDPRQAEPHMHDSNNFVIVCNEKTEELRLICLKSSRALLLATLNDIPCDELPEEMLTTIGIQLDHLSLDNCRFYEIEQEDHNFKFCVSQSSGLCCPAGQVHDSTPSPLCFFWNTKTLRGRYVCYACNKSVLLDGRKAHEIKVVDLMTKGFLNQLTLQDDAALTAAHHSLERCQPCDGHMTAEVTSDCNLCYVKLFKTGEARTHRDHRSVLLVTKSKITAVCEDHGTVSATRFGNAEQRTDLRIAVGLHGDTQRKRLIDRMFSDAPEVAGSVNENVKRMGELINEFAQCHKLRKVVSGKDVYVLQQREDCPFDFVHFEPRMDMKRLYQYMNKHDTDFRDLTRMRPIYKDYEMFMITEDEDAFPVLQRSPDFDAVRNGLVFYTVNNQPGVRFVPYEDAARMVPSPGVCRKYIDQDFKPEWLTLFDGDRAKYFTDIVPLTYGILDVQEMHDDVQTFNIRGRDMTEQDDVEWTVSELLIALIFGRPQYAPTQQIQMRIRMPFWVYMWGQSGTAKTVLAMVLAQFFSTDKWLKVTTNTEDQFGLQKLPGKELLIFPEVRKPGRGKDFPIDSATMNLMIDMERFPAAVKNDQTVEILAPQPVGAGNVLPRDVWSDPSGSLTRRTAMFQFKKLFTGVANDQLHVDIFETEGLALKVFGVLMFRRLLTHVTQVSNGRRALAGYGSWDISYFKDENRKASIASDPLTDFLTQPQMGKEGGEYHYEYKRGARVLKKDFDHKFDCFMKFERNQDYDAGQINAELSLVRAAQTIKGGPAPMKGPHVMKLIEVGWFECRHCHQDVDVNWGKEGARLDGTPASSCCSAYHTDTRPKSTKKKDVDTKAIRHRDRVVPYIKNLALVRTGTATAARGGPVTHNALPWNGTCKCVRKHLGMIQGCEQAIKKTSTSDQNPGRDYWTCMKGDTESGGCGFFQWVDELQSLVDAGVMNA